MWLRKGGGAQPATVTDDGIRKRDPAGSSDLLAIIVAGVVFARSRSCCCIVEEGFDLASSADGAAAVLSGCDVGSPC